MEILLFIFFLLVFIGLLIGSYVVRSIRNFKKAVEQAADLRAQQMRNEVGRKNQQYSQRSTTTNKSNKSDKASDTQESYEAQQPHNNYQQKETIIDHHQKKRESRKIFDDEEGEYVEFTEEK